MDTYNILTCPKCGNHINVRSDETDVACFFCGEILTNSQSQPEPSPDLQNKTIKVEANTNTDTIWIGTTKFKKKDNGFVLTHGWISMNNLFWIFLALGLDLYILRWVNLINYYPASLRSEKIMSLLPWFFTGFLLNYIGVAALVNRTKVTAKNGKIIIRQTPFLWPGNRTVSFEDIQEIVIHEIESGLKRLFVSPFSLVIIKKDSSQVTLIRDLASRETSKLFLDKINNSLTQTN